MLLKEENKENRTKSSSNELNDQFAKLSSPSILNTTTTTTTTTTKNETKLKSKPCKTNKNKILKKTIHSKKKRTFCFFFADKPKIT